MMVSWCVSGGGIEGGTDKSGVDKARKRRRKEEKSECLDPLTSFY